jgi:putative ABC transport system permease protein
MQSLQPTFLSVDLNAGSSSGTISILNDVVTALAVALALIAVVGVFNTLLLSTRERVRDTAVLKALGMSPGQTMLMVSASAGLLGVLGGVAGVPAGVALHYEVLQLMSSLVGSQAPFNTFSSFNPVLLPLLSLAGVLLSLVGAALPARWAAKSPVAEILHSE